MADILAGLILLVIALTIICTILSGIFSVLGGICESINTKYQECIEKYGARKVTIITYFLILFGIPVGIPLIVYIVAYFIC